MPAPAPTFEGVYPILVTPFLPDEQLDLASFQRLVRRMGELGVDGVTILGVLGEANRLTDAERDRLIETAVAAAAGRFPVIVGASHAGTAATCALGRRAAELGAGGLMITPSREPVPNEQRIFEYFAAVAEQVPLPIVLQDHPASTQVHMSVPLLLRLVSELPRIACIKAEAAPSPPRVSALLDGMTARRVPILVGLGALYGMFDLERGASGFMTGFAFPEVLQGMLAAMHAGDPARAWALYRRFLPLIVFEQQPGLAIRKELYRRRGLIDHPTVRHPGANIDPRSAAQLEALLDQVLPGTNLTAPLALGE